MTICARCGLPDGSLYGNTPAVCTVKFTAGTGDAESSIIACRDLELMNLRSLLRSVTGKLEEAAEECANGEPRIAGGIIASVLEILS